MQITYLSKFSPFQKDGKIKEKGDSKIFLILNLEFTNLNNNNNSNNKLKKGRKKRKI